MDIPPAVCLIPNTKNHDPVSSNSLHIDSAEIPPTVTPWFTHPSRAGAEPAATPAFYIFLASQHLQFPVAITLIMVFLKTAVYSNTHLRQINIKALCKRPHRGQVSDNQTGILIVHVSRVHSVGGKGNVRQRKMGGLRWPVKQ